MQEFHLIIAMLTAIASYAKDIHYTVKGSSAYSEHLFADLLQDDLYDYIDQIKENVLLGNKVLPKPSKEYLAMAIPMIPDISFSDSTNFTLIEELINKTRNALSNIETNSRGANALLDNISETLDKSAGLLFLQTRVEISEALDENEVKTEHCPGEDEKQLKDSKPKDAKINYPEVEKTIKRQEAENVMVAEESALDRVSRKLGV